MVLRGLREHQIKDALTTSLKVALEVTLVSTIVGTAAAFPLVRSRLPFRSGITVGMTLPIMIPGLLIGVSLLILMTSFFHIQLSVQTAVIGQAVYTTPFVLLLVAARLQGFDTSLERAASDLGANTFNRLRYIVLPLIMPAVFAGALFAFTLSLDEFIITLFLIGAHNTLPIYIYTQVKFGITPEVNALASLLLAASLILIAFAFLLPADAADATRCGQAARSRCLLHALTGVILKGRATRARARRYVRPASLSIDKYPGVRALSTAASTVATPRWPSAKVGKGSCGSPATAR